MRLLVKGHTLLNNGRILGEVPGEVSRFSKVPSYIVLSENDEVRILLKKYLFMNIGTVCELIEESFKSLQEQIDCAERVSANKIKDCENKCIIKINKFSDFYRKMYRNEYREKLDRVLSDLDSIKDFKSIEIIESSKAVEMVEPVVDRKMSKDEELLKPGHFVDRWIAMYRLLYPSKTDDGVK